MTAGVSQACSIRRMPVEVVGTARARRVAGDTISPLLADFVAVRPGEWVLRLSDGVRAVLTLAAWKGGQFSLVPGVCCSWVPLMWNKGDVYDWPRTIKQTLRQLWLDHFVEGAPNGVVISRLAGEAELVRSAAQAVAEATHAADPWWSSLHETEGVLREAVRQAASPHDTHFPCAEFVEAFTLAQLGEVEEGEQRLESLIGEGRVEADSVEYLRTALRQKRLSFRS